MPRKVTFLPTNATDVPAKTPDVPTKTTPVPTNAPPVGRKGLSCRGKSFSCPRKSVSGPGPERPAGWREQMCQRKLHPSQGSERSGPEKQPRPGRPQPPQDRTPSPRPDGIVFWSRATSAAPRDRAIVLRSTAPARVRPCGARGWARCVRVHCGHACAEQLPAMRV